MYTSRFMMLGTAILALVVIEPVLAQSRGSRSEGATNQRHCLNEEPGSFTQENLATRPTGENSRRPPNFFVRLMQFDVDSSGTLSQSEIPERMAGLFKHDTNEDGELDRAELEEMANQQNSRSKASRNNRMVNDASGPRRRQDDRLGPDHPAFGNSDRGQPHGAEQLVAHAMQFDSDGNGELNEQELLAFARQLGPPPGNDQNRRQRGGRGEGPRQRQGNGRRGR